MMIFKRASFYFAILGILAAVKLAGQLRKTPPAPAPLVEPARSPFSNTVAATGIIEASKENVRVGTPKPGLLTKVYVQVGSRVKEGDPLLQLDDREARAKVVTTRAQVDALRAALKAEQVMAADAADQFQRVDKLQKDKVASDDERIRKEFQWHNWQARVARLEADVRAAQAIADQAQVELDVLTIRAPREGTMLQINVRAGEFAETKPIEPMMILGEVDRLQIRADVDEQNAPLVQTNQPAVAFLKGSTQNPLPLRFVRIEPYVIPKKSLTGDSAERVDTRVLQIIYELERASPSSVAVADPRASSTRGALPLRRVDVPLYVGQQVDVFINRPVDAASAEPVPSERR